MLSLKKLLSLTAVVSLALLVIVLFLAFFQQKITSSYGEVLERGQTIVFRFTSLRDHLINAMLEEKWESFRDAGDELEAINQDLLNLLDHPYVPASFKVSLADRVDIQGIALLARKIGSTGDRKTTSIQLAESLREMADQLFRLDRVLVGQMNERLIQFQKIAIGALTLITGMIGLLMTVLYRRGFRPLLILIARMKGGESITSITPPSGACLEFSEFIGLIKSRMEGEHSGNSHPVPILMAKTINSVSNLLNGIINYAQLLLDECQNQQGSDQHKAMLNKIVAHSEEISRLVLPEEHDRFGPNKPDLSTANVNPQQ